MEEYKPTRFSSGNYRESFSRSLGISLARELWGAGVKDYYIHISLWKWYFTVVFLRLNN